MNHLERLFDLSLDMLCIAGFDGYFKRVNPAFTNILGYAAEELLNRPFLELVHPDDRAATREAMAQLIDGQPVLDFENRYVCRDGSLRWLAWRACSVSEEGNVYAVARDVTDARRLARKSEAGALLRSLVEGTSSSTGTDFFCSLVRHLAEVLEVRYCLVSECPEETSEQARTLAFWNGEGFGENFTYDVTGTPCERVFAGEPCLCGERVRELFPDDADLVELDAESYIAVPVTSSAGKVIGLLAAIDTKPFDAAGFDVSLLQIFASRAGAELERHRSEKKRRQLQAQVLHSQKLESLGVLAGGIAHDFNNLLVGILGNSGLALQEAPADSRLRPFLKRIELAAQRAADLANQMLAYSGKGQFIVETIQLTELLDDMGDLLRTSISKKAHLRFDFADGVPPIDADATQIRQVVLNLVTNASDALEGKSGSIVVRVEAVDVDAALLGEAYPGGDLAPGRYVGLIVKDTGCGMDDATRSKIFDPFFTTKRTGRGLGMAAVLGIVRGHGGVIRIDSELGHGSTSTVLLPASTGQVEAKSYRVAERPPGDGHGKILVVDDEELVRQVAQLTLESAGYEVLLAEDGLEALEIYLREGPSIVGVVLDLTMPRMGGEETFGELHRLSGDLPVVLTSGFNEQDAASRFGEARPAGFLKKPFRPADLAEKIRQVLG